MMAYKVFYRKYRPDSFQKIIGEQAIVDNLKQSIIDNSFSHAYIFTGPRGCGKTSTAKVLAKTINCMNIQNGEACNECESCRNITTSPDIIEIDAASNNGVDEIRELRNNITLAPAASKYKIYIIDEVHMLTAGAFNALLKTLEEPPAHAIFILATTEVYKVPITILSRCQRYDFKKLNHDELVEHLKNICKNENITYEENALDEIYELSDGCARDALSILDQLSKSREKLTLNNVLAEYNSISNETIEKLLNHTINNDYQEVIETIKNFENSGMNAQKLIKKMINYLESIALKIKLNTEKKYTFEFIGKLIKDLNQLYIDARINKNIFSMIILSFLELMDSPSENTSKKTSKKQLVVNTKDDPPKKPLQNEDVTEERISLKSIRINNCFADASKEALNDVIEVWNSIDNSKISFITIKDYKPVAASKTNVIFSVEENSQADLFNMKHEEIEKLLKKNKMQLKIVAITNEEWNKEKEKYKTRIKNKIPYRYIEEPIIEEDGNLKGQIGDLFTEKIIEIS